MRGFSGLVLLLAATVLCAENIELWNRKTIRDVEIVKAEKGWLYYKQESGRTSKAKLIDIKTIDRVDRFCKILSFEDSQLKRRAGKLLTVSITVEDVRIREPLIRVYALEKDDKGVRSLRLYQNVRIYDPTRVEKLPNVESKSYLEKKFFLERDLGVSFRIEIWLNGRLRTYKEVGGDDLERDWWRSMKLVSTSSLRPLSKDDATKAEEVAAVKKEEAVESAKGDCQIETFSLNPPAGKKYPRLKVKYSLGGMGKTIETPKVIFHYVTEKDGEKEIQSTTCQSGGRSVKMKRGKYEDTIERNLPSNIRIHPSLLELKKEDVSRLVYWRLEFRRDDDELILVKEAPYTAIKKTLPDGWWE